MDSREIRVTTGTPPGGTAHRLVPAADIEKYAARNEREQLIARAGLREALSLAARDAGLDGSLGYEQVAGEGELMVLPEDADVPTLVGEFTRRTEAVLGLFDRRAPSDRRLRLRLALAHLPETTGRPSGECARRARTHHPSCR